MMVRWHHHSTNPGPIIQEFIAMKKFSLTVLGSFFVLNLITGCGEKNTDLPKALTEEQKKAIKAEDEAVANEEGGRVKKKGGKLTR